MLKRTLFIVATLVFVLNATPLLKTGQTLSYDGSGTKVTDGSIKDDGFYQKGVTRNYSRIGDIVIDNVTGLQWQDNEGIPKPWLTQANYDAGNYNNTLGDTAATYCSQLSLGSYDDWRLPDIVELETLVEYNRSEDDFYYLASDVFKHIIQGYYWSSTTNAKRTSFAWMVSSNHGDSKFLVSDKSEPFTNTVRCVRGKHLDKPSLSSSNEVVSDDTTKLQWQDDVNGEFVEKKWSEAVEYCETLGYDNHYDWRLPNIKELLSITDRASYMDSLDPVFANFDPAIVDYDFWSSTSMVGGESDAWSINFYYGEVKTMYKKNIISIRCVRDNSIRVAPLLKTGLTESYDSDGNVVTDGSLKDDGYYQAGLTRNYSRNNNIVTDNVTGLQWQDDESITKKSKEAKTYCSTRTLGSYTDWRLPSMKELNTLSVLRIPEDRATIDDVFKNTYRERYLSSDVISLNSSYVWSMSFNYGYLYETNIEEDSEYVRCVRGQLLDKLHFSRKNEVVSDTATKLQWQDNVEVKALSSRKTWRKAIDYCENLTLDSNDDWRLPNKTELLSVVDYSRSNPAIYSVFENTTVENAYWSSSSKYYTSVNYNYATAWFVDFNDGDTGDNYKNIDEYSVRCVRGGQIDNSESSVKITPIIMYLLN